MEIRSMFVKPIDRDVKGVIKVGQSDDENVFQELDEYVVTKELARHFSTLFEAYQRSIGAHTDKMGVWISGFFGSGKSHFLKVIGYLLENKESQGKSALEYFENKILDPLVFASIERAARANNQVVLFNIDSKGDADTRVSKDAVVKVFAKVFYEMLGYYGRLLWLAEMERQLDLDGKYDSFRLAFRGITGRCWEERRAVAHFEKANITRALVSCGAISEAEADTFFDHIRDDYSLSVDSFTGMVRDYVNAQDGDFHLVFLVDEIGQYIGDNQQLILNLQTVVEDLGTKCGGKVWVMVTSQQEIDSIVKVKGNDFSRILARFDTRLSLSSANVDEVIKRRLLQKTDVAKDTLRILYHHKEGVLRNLFSFSEGTPNMRVYADEEDFVETYPFVPYQFQVLQKVFEAVRLHGASGKHLAEGARSMLSAVQDAAISVFHLKEGALAPFSVFYDSMETFLDASIREVIEAALANPALDPFDVSVLKVLFMVKYVKEMPATIENLTTLLLTSIDEDKLALRDRIKNSLERLIRQTLVQKNGDEYIFLTNDEQDIDREIKSTAIDPAAPSRFVDEIIFSELYINRKVRYSNHYDFEYWRKVDGRGYGPQRGEIGVCVSSPFDDSVALHEREQQVIWESTHNPDALYIFLPDNNELVEEVEAFLRLELYLKQKPTLNLPESIAAIMTAKERELKARRKRAVDMIGEDLARASLYVAGQSIQERVSTPSERISKGFEHLVASVFTKISYIDTYISDPRELEMLRSDDEESLKGLQTNSRADDEVVQFLSDATVSRSRITAKTIMDRFHSKPYGWGQLDIAGVVIRLLRRKEIRMIHESQYIDLSDRRIVTYLTNQREQERLIIQKRRLADAELIKLLRDVSLQVFAVSDIPTDDEDGAIKKFRSIVSDSLEKSKDLLRNYDDGPYPGKQVVDLWVKKLTDLLSIDDGSHLKQALDAERGRLIELEEQVQKVRDFFESQRRFFDQALMALEIYERNKTDLLGSKSEEAASALKDIVADAEPYGKIQRIPNLVAQIESALERVLTDKKKEVLALVDAIRKEIQNECSNNGIGLAQILQRVPEIDGTEQRLNSATSVNDVLAEKYRCEKAREKALQAMESLVASRQSGSQGTAATAVVRDIVIPRGRVLSTVGDVDAFVSKLRQELVDVINQGASARISVK